MKYANSVLSECSLEGFDTANITSAKVLIIPLKIKKIQQFISPFFCFWSGSTRGRSFVVRGAESY